MSPSAARGLSRVVRVLVPVSILGIVLLAIASVGFIEYSAQPGFCKNCHLMQTYYDSWSTSAHRTVPCIKCHYAPGIKAEAMGKLQAANQVVKYVTGAYGTRPWAEIDDAACLRSGCHSERLIMGVVEFRGVRFDHTDHLGELRRGMQLRCTSCHSQIVQGSHIAVTVNTCFLCHFRDRPPGEPLAGCTGCHPSPPRVVSPEGFGIDHAQYVKDRISCVSCHNQVTEGTGAVDQARCYACHNEPDRISQFTNPPRLHQVHVADHNLSCIQCHAPLEHRVIALTTTARLDCQSCHAQVHEEQQRLYAGVGGHGVPDSPSSMFLARVSCLGCHAQAAKLRGHDNVRVAGEPSCLSCHGIRYANILPAWQREMDAKVARVQTVVDQAQAALAGAPVRSRALADSLVGLARENLDLVRVGKGAHNIEYADGLLRASLSLVQQATRRAALPYTVPDVPLGGPPVSENRCLQCHLGVERRAGQFQGERFDHTPHVLRSGLGCSECHTPLDQHGGITLRSAASCSGCHHPVVQPQNCARCHPGPGGAPQQTFSLPSGDFSHGVHGAANLACSACHVAPLMSARALKCQTCHENHHQPDRACLSCHRGGVQELHDRSTHVACAECHESVPGLNRWTRQVCTTCHPAQIDHNPSQQCDVCHRVPAMNASGGS